MRALGTGHWALVAVVLAALCAIGCAATPREQYEAAEILYTRTLDGLALAAAAGEADADDLAAIEPYRATVRAALDRAKEIVQSGQELAAGDVRVFDAALEAWLTAMLARGIEEAPSVREDPDTSPVGDGGGSGGGGGRRDAAPTGEDPTEESTDGH